MEKGEVLVRVIKSFTKNLGNYNSARVEYGLEKIVDEALEFKTTQELGVKIDDFLEEELRTLVESNKV